MKIAVIRAMIGVLMGVGYAVGAPAVQTVAPVRLVVDLPARVMVGAGPVNFGSVASLSTQDLSILRRAMAVPLGTAPRAGAPVVLDRETLVHWLAARTGLRLDQVAWRGASEVEVAVATQELAGQRITDAAQASLRLWLGAHSRHFETELISGPQDLVVPTGTVALKIRPLALHGLPSRRMRVWIDLYIDDRFVRTLTASFEVRAWAELPVADEDFAAGHTLGATSQRSAEVDLTRLRLPPRQALHRATGDAALPAQGLRLREPLRAGAPLAEARLEVEPSVKRGYWARMDAQNGSVTVQRRVEVLQDGHAGETVRVKLPGASGSMLARVVGLQQVELRP